MQLVETPSLSFESIQTSADFVAFMADRPSLLAQIDAHCARLQAAYPWIPVNRRDAVRDLLLREVQALAGETTTAAPLFADMRRLQEKFARYWRVFRRRQAPLPPALRAEIVQVLSDCPFLVGDARRTIEKHIRNPGAGAPAQDRPRPDFLVSSWRVSRATARTHRRGDLRPLQETLARVQTWLLSLQGLLHSFGLEAGGYARQIHDAAFQRSLCTRALADFDREPEAAQWFVTQVLTLPSSYCPDVWEALQQRRWMQARKPLHYVRSVAQRLYGSARRMFTETSLSLDAPGPTGQLLRPTLHTSSDPWPTHEAWYDAEQRIAQEGLSAGLSPDALVLYKLRRLHDDHVSRRTLPDLLQWSPQRVERAWREMHRKMSPQKKLG